MRTTSKKDFVYYTAPTGYDAPVNKGMPIFFQRINNGKQQYNFELMKAKDQTQHAFLVWAE